MPVTKNKGSVRVDLVGGTIDLDPINFVLPNVVTLNVATGLQAEVEIEDDSSSKLTIVSEDYNKTYQYQLEDITEQKLYANAFAEMSFVVQLVSCFPKRGLKVTLRSGAPAGSGLGGSSAMGVTLFSALAKHFGQTYKPQEIVTAVKSVESRILNQGVAGYQDYYPALFGGVLALRPSLFGVQVEQLYSNELKNYLEKHVTLIYSGISRSSGINNWEVYKGFFDKKKEMRDGLTEVASISYQLYQAIKNAEFEHIPKLIAREGEVRAKLFPGIVPPEVLAFTNDLASKVEIFGQKMCGAGGGGCFILLHAPGKSEQIVQIANSHQMKVLPFDITAPISLQ